MLAPRLAVGRIGRTRPSQYCSLDAFAFDIIPRPTPSCGKCTLAQKPESFEKTLDRAHCARYARPSVVLRVSLSLTPISKVPSKGSSAILSRLGLLSSRCFGGHSRWAPRETRLGAFSARTKTKRAVDGSISCGPCFAVLLLQNVFPVAVQNVGRVPDASLLLYRRALFCCSKEVVDKTTGCVCCW